MPVGRFIVNNQQVLIFNLGIAQLQRSDRHRLLDSKLSQWFAKQNLVCQIIHTPAKPAVLLLTNQHTTHHYQLAISYALPWVAVSWLPNSAGAIGIDLVAISEFESMAQAERQIFAEQYFPKQAMGILDNNTMAKNWADFEAKLKCLRLPLQPYTLCLEQVFQQLTTDHIPLMLPFNSLITKPYWLSFVKEKCQ